MKRLTPKRRPSKTTKVARREHPAVVRPRSSSAVNLQKQLDQRTRELAEAQKRLAEAFEQQTTTSEILGVIAHSATDVQPVLDTVCQSAARLCEAYDSTIWRPDGDQLVPIAHYGPITQVESLALVRGTVAGRTVLDKRTLHIADVQAEVHEFPETSKNARRLSFRTILSVPLMRRSSRHRHRERAPAQRVAGIAPAADRHRRRAQGHQPLDLRSANRAGHAC